MQEVLSSLQAKGVQVKGRLPVARKLIWKGSLEIVASGFDDGRGNPAFIGVGWQTTIAAGVR